MGNVLGRVPVDRIEAEAREIHLLRTVLTVLAAVLFAIGWAAGKLWLSVAWSIAAVRVGFRDGRARDDGAG